MSQERLLFKRFDGNTNKTASISSIMIKIGGKDFNNFFSKKAHVFLYPNKKEQTTAPT